MNNTSNDTSNNTTNEPGNEPGKAAFQPDILLAGNAWLLHDTSRYREWLRRQWLRPRLDRTGAIEHKEQSTS